MKRLFALILATLLCISGYIMTASAATKNAAPKAPTISASNVTSTGKIKLSWKAVDGAEQYKVYRATSKNGSYVYLGRTSGTSYVNSSATAGKIYYYYVKAVSSSGKMSKASNTVSRTCDLACPVVSLSNVESSGKIKLTWKAIDGAVSYKVYRSTSKNGTYTLLGTTKSTSYTNTSVVVGKMYYYRVMAVSSNTNANSAKSQAKSRTCDLPRPSITLTNVASSGKIRISWNKVEGAVSYQVYRSKDNKNWSLLSTTTKTAITNTSAVAGTKYYYKVRAVHSNTAANSAYSTSRYRTCDLARPVVKVSNEEATGKVYISWGKIANAVSYRVYRSDTKNGTYTCIKTTQDTAYADNSAQVGGTYYYKVRAVCAKTDGNSVDSAIHTGTYESLKTLKVVGSLNDAGKPKLTWNKIEGAVEYNVYRSITLNGEYKKISTTTYASLTNGSAASGVTYYYKVAAVDASGKEFLMTEQPISVKAAPPSGETLTANYVIEPMLTIYSLPDSSSESVILPYMAEVQMGAAVTSGSSGKWMRLFYQDALYYVWVDAGEVRFTDKKSSFQYTGNNQYQQDAVDLAVYICQNWKTEYMHDQSNGIPNADGVYGFDCSGFVTYVLNTVMQKTVPTYRLTSNIGNLRITDTIYNTGYPGEFHATTVSLEDLQPGDILFFSQKEPYDHCGMYLGNGEFVHSSNYWENSVNIAPLTGSYLEQLSDIRRYLPEQVTAAETDVGINNTGAKLYATKSTEGEILAQFVEEDVVTVLYTNGDNWAYVRTKDGVEGFILTKNLSPLT